MDYDIVDFALGTYGAVWAGLNAYTLYPEFRRRIESFTDLETENQSEDKDIYEDMSIDILIPAYDEAEVIEHPLSSIEAADGLESEVNTYVLLEPDDDMTQEAVAEIETDYEFESITVPEEYPGNGAKPRALNYGFEVSDGDLVSVIDAEDQVSEDFFKEVYNGLVDTEKEYGQGILDMSNEGEGWKNLQFRAEYGNWFRQIIKAYENANYPVPLGGTTNAFTRDVLDDMSEYREDRFGKTWDIEDSMWLFENGLDGSQPWNPNNVAEDFELGMMLWEEDYDMEMFDTETTEQSPKSLSDWVRQRTRWQKGRLQTLGQYLQNPPEEPLGKLHVYTQSASPSIGLINSTGVALSAGVASTGAQSALAASLVTGAGAAGVLAHLGLQADGYRRATDRDGVKKLGKGALAATTVPIYWGMQWIADGRAIKQYLKSDSSWEKTPHEDVENMDRTEEIGETEEELEEK